MAESSGFGMLDTLGSLRARSIAGSEDLEPRNAEYIRQHTHYGDFTVKVYALYKPEDLSAYQDVMQLAASQGLQMPKVGSKWAEVFAKDRVFVPADLETPAHWLVYLEYRVVEVKEVENA
jgi:hypothetical protein